MGAGGRYLALHVDRTKARPRYAYLLFGAGPRVSIGASFAMIEATVIGWIIVGLWTTESLRTRSSPNQLRAICSHYWARSSSLIWPRFGGASFTVL